MSRKRPTEASWDSDDDLLREDISGITAFHAERDEDIDEDALLAGSDEDDMDAGKAGESLVEAIMADQMNSYDHIEVGNNSSALETSQLSEGYEYHKHLPSSSPHNDRDGDGEAVLDVIVDAQEIDEALGLTAGSDFDESDCMGHQGDHQGEAKTEAIEIHKDIQQEASFSHSQEVSELEDQDVEQEGDEHPRPESEDSEEEEDDEKEQRGRFKSERGGEGLIKLITSRERTDIPDTLEISAEEQARIDDFEHQKHNRFHRGRGRQGWQGRGGNRGMGPSYPGGPPRHDGPGHHQHGPRPHFPQQGGFQQHGQRGSQHQPSDNCHPYPGALPQRPGLGPPPRPTPGPERPQGMASTPANQPRKIHFNPRFLGNLQPGPQFSSPQSTASQMSGPAAGLQASHQQQQQPLRPVSMAMSHHMAGRPLQAQSQPFQQRPSMAWSSPMQQPQPQPTNVMVGAPRQPFPQQPFQPQRQQQPMGLQQQPQQSLRPQISANHPQPQQQQQSPSLQQQQQPRPMVTHLGMNTHQMTTPHSQQGPGPGFDFPQPQLQANRSPGSPAFGGRGGPTPPYPTEWNRPTVLPLQQQQQPRFSEPHHQPRFNYQGAPVNTPRQQNPQEQYQPNTQQHFSHPQQNGPQRFGQSQPPFGQQHHSFGPPQQAHQDQRFGQPGGFQQQSQPPRQAFHGREQRFNSPPSQQMQDQSRFKSPPQRDAEPQPIQTVLRGVQQAKSAQSLSNQQQPRPQRPVLTQQQLQRQKRFAQGAAGNAQPGMALKTKIQLQTRSSQSSMAAKKLQAAKQFGQRQAAQKRVSQEAPQASPPKQPRVVVKTVQTSVASSAEEIMDADLAAKLSEQKRLREQIRKQKEMRRQAQASKRRADLMIKLKEQGLTLEDIKDPEENTAMPPPQQVPPKRPPQAPQPAPQQAPQQAKPIPVQQRLGRPGPPPQGPGSPLVGQQQGPGEKIVQMTKAQYQAKLRLGQKMRVVAQGQGQHPANQQGLLGRGGMSGRGGMPGRGAGPGRGGLLQQGVVPGHGGILGRGGIPGQGGMAGRGGMPGRGGPQGQGGRGRGGWTMDDFGPPQGGPGPNEGYTQGPGQNFHGRGRGMGGGPNGFNQQPQPGHPGPHQMGSPPNQGPGMGHAQVGPPWSRGRQVSLNQGQGQNGPTKKTSPANSNDKRSVFFSEDQPQQGQGGVGGGKRRIVLSADQKPMDTVCITNLSASTSPHQLLHMCSQVGPTTNVQMMQNRAIIKFVNPDHATMFQRKFNRHMLDLSHIHVSLVPN